MGPHEAPDRQNHRLGVFLVVLVAAIWVLAGELVQYIYGEGGTEYDKPFFVTYFSTSLFAVLLIRPTFAARSQDGSIEVDGFEELQSGPLISYTEQKLSVKETARLGLMIWPPWFIANYTFAYSLRVTTVASASTISALSGLFTLIGGTLTGTERFAMLKLAAVGLTVVGVALIGKSDKEEKGDESFVGDLIAVISAMTYSVYTTMLKFRVERDDQLDTSLFFGFLGAFNTILGIPFLLLLHFIGFESLESPSSKTLVLMIVNGLIGTVLSDYLWARAVLLTTPLIATLAIALSVPMSVIADIVLHHESFTISYVLGLCLVVAGFIAVNKSEEDMLETSDRHQFISAPLELNG